MRWIFDIITILGFGLTAVGTYLTAKSGEAAVLIQTPIVKVSLIIAVIAAVGWYHYYHKSMIMKSVLEGRDHIAGALHMISEVSRQNTSKTNVQKGIEQLSEICQKVSAGMRKYHTPNISVCIQYINKDNLGPYVKVLCRNTDSKKRHDKRPISALTKDYINENTDFQYIIPMLSIVNSEKIYYINNALPFSPFYRNSRFSKSKRIKYYGHLGIFYRICDWELPYKSTLVVPIIEENKGTCTIQGFLSIDSPKYFSFSRKYDLPIIRHLADALAPVIGNYNRHNLI